MSDIHLSRDLLAARARGDIDSNDLLSIALQHLSRHCEHCREELLAWQRQRDGGGSPRLLDTLSCLLQREEPAAVEQRHDDLRARVEELLMLPPEDQEARVSAEPDRYGSPSMAWLILKNSRRLLKDDPVEAEHLAALAMLVLWYSPQAEDSSGELLARAHAYSAAACRRQNRDEAADESFRAARILIQKQGLTDSLLIAEIDSLEAVLRHRQRRLPTAILLYQRSALLYRLSHRPLHAARMLFRLGAVYGESFQFSRAIDTTRDGLALLSPTDHRSLVFRGRHELAWYLCDAGRFAEAERVALENAPEDGTEIAPQHICRQMWLQGRIAAGRARPRDAERSLRAAQRGSLEYGHPQDAILVTLELAHLYYREGRTEEVQRLVEALPSQCSEPGMNRRILVGLLNFLRTFQSGGVTDSLFLHLKRRLYRTLKTEKYCDMA